MHHHHRLTPATIAAAIFLTAAIAPAQQVFFSPNGGTAAAIVADLDAATQSVDVAAFSITETPILDALTRCAQRGIPVRVVLDRRQSNLPNSAAKQLPARGLAARIDPNHTTMHAKSIQIDKRLTYAGSYNWSTNAETRNVELCFRITDPETNRQLATWFQHLFDQSAKKRTNRSPQNPPHQPQQRRATHGPRHRSVHVPRRIRHPRRNTHREPLEGTQLHAAAGHTA